MFEPAHPHERAEDLRQRLRDYDTKGAEDALVELLIDVQCFCVEERLVIDAVYARASRRFDEGMEDIPPVVTEPPKETP